MIIHVPKSSLDLTNAKVLQVTENSKDIKKLLLVEG